MLFFIFIISLISISGSSQEIGYNFDSEIKVKKNAKLEESPYSMFGDNTFVLQTKHEEEKDHMLKIPIIEDNKEIGIFALDFQTGIIKAYDDSREVVLQKQLAKEELTRFTSIDPLSEKYYSISPYAYVGNNPINAIDPDGKRIYFVGGANNDSDGWNYIGRTSSIWTDLGLKDFSRVNASNGKLGDMGFSANYRNNQSFTRYTSGGMFGGSVSYETQATSNNGYNEALNHLAYDLKTNGIPNGEQLNLAGYSYGAVLQAHLAIGLVGEGKIGNIIRYDIPGDKLSNPKSQSDFLGGVWQGFIEMNNAPHFDLARPGSAADDKIREAGKYLLNNG